MDPSIKATPPYIEDREHEKRVYSRKFGKRRMTDGGQEATHTERVEPITPDNNFPTPSSSSSSSWAVITYPPPLDSYNSPHRTHTH